MYCSHKGTCGSESSRQLVQHELSLQLCCKMLVLTVHDLTGAPPRGNLFSDLKESAKNTSNG